MTLARQSVKIQTFCRGYEGASKGCPGLLAESISTVAVLEEGKAGITGAELEQHGIRNPLIPS